MPSTHRPDPEPLETDDVRVITVGTVLWFAAFLVALLLRDRLADAGNENWLWILLAGGGLGLLGIHYVRRRRDALRRDAGAGGDGLAPPPGEPPA